MGKKKSETTQNQTQSQNQNYNNASTNSYSQITPNDTADISKFRDWNPQIDPGLGAQYGAAHERLHSSFINPLGGYSTPQMRDAQQRTGDRQLNQDEASAFRSGQYDVNNQKAGQLGTLATLTAPRLVQTGSTASGTGTSSGTSSGTGTTVQSGDLLGQILGGAAQVGSAALM
jgi:hypothetical protein